MRRLPVVGPYDLLRSLRPLADGGGDPTWCFARAGSSPRAARAMWTPRGAVTVELHLDGSELVVRATGAGSAWVLERAEWLSGLADDPGGFRFDHHPGLAGLQRRFPGLRLARSLVLWDVIVPIVLGQRVTTGEARRAWRGMVRRYGHAAPGTSTVRLPPRPACIARLGDADWHRLGVERGRADAVRGLLRVLPALERVAGDGAECTAERTAEFRRVAERVPRVGPWTSTALASAVLADPDVVLLGDLHLPHAVCHALAGEARGDDARMLELLEPFRPHRARVVRVLSAAARGAPRRGPRSSPPPLARR